MSDDTTTRDVWTGAFKLREGTAQAFRQFAEQLYPNPKTRPPMREIADEVFSIGLDAARQAVKPEPSPLDRLRAARSAA